jgi:hypothetical protein
MIGRALSRIRRDADLPFSRVQSGYDAEVAPLGRHEANSFLLGGERRIFRASGQVAPGPPSLLASAPEGWNASCVRQFISHLKAIEHDMKVVGETA